MRFRQLEYFVAVARKRHFARAAAARHFSQPALSGVTGVLRLGVVPTASTTVALAITAFCAAHPLARVEIKSSLSAVEIARRLRTFALDVGVTYLDDGGDPRLIFVPVDEERYVLIASDELIPDIPSTMAWLEASALPLAVLTTQMRGRQVVGNTCEQNQIRMVPQVETDSIASLHAHMNAASPGSVTARAFAAVAARLSLRELFDRELSRVAPEAPATPVADR